MVDLGAQLAGSLVVKGEAVAVDDVLVAAESNHGCFCVCVLEGNVSLLSEHMVELTS